MTFDFHLQDGTLDAIAAMGYDEPTAIQAQAIPPMLAGRDVVAMARTGTGKTAAFGIPIVDRHRSDRDGIPALILLPTRELALQVTEVMQDLAQASRLRVVPVYGGAGFGKQLDGLSRKGAKVVVATPGRLLDLVDRGALDLSQIQTWVLDEADRMLDMGFVRDMRRIEQLLPSRKQVALYSATFPKEVEKLVREFTNDPVRVSVHDGEATVPQTEQLHARVEKNEKTTALLHYLHHHTPQRGIVFTRTKHLAKRLAHKLVNKGWSAVALQGNMSQGQRERAMDAFRKGEARILVATDVAARGLDVPNVSHVINFDLPDPDSYVHRIGRTARNGAEGVAVTFVQSDQVRDFKGIQSHIGKQVPWFEPTLSEDVPEGPDPKVAPAQEPPAGRAGSSGSRRRRRTSAARHGSQQGQRHGRHQGSGGSRRGQGSQGGSRGRSGGYRQGGQGGQRRSGHSGRGSSRSSGSR